MWQEDQRPNQNGSQRGWAVTDEPRPITIVYPEDLELQPIDNGVSPQQHNYHPRQTPDQTLQDLQFGRVPQRPGQQVDREEQFPRQSRTGGTTSNITDGKDEPDGNTVTDTPEKPKKPKQSDYARVCVHCIIPGSEQDDFLASYKWCPPPISMIIISIIQIIIFIVYAVELENNGIEVTAMSGVPSYSPLMYKADRRYEAWRFLTYMFIHIGYLHLTFNVMIQLLLGVPLEWVQTWRVPVLYLIGVISGSLAHSLTDHRINLAGASGGGYSLIGAHLATIAINWKEMNYKCWDGNFCRLLTSAPVRLSLVLTIALSDTGMALYKRFAENSHEIGISAHIGGLLAGLLIGIPFLKNVRKNPWEKTTGWVTLAVYLAVVVVIVIFNGLYKGYPPTDWRPCCP